MALPLCEGCCALQENGERSMQQSLLMRSIMQIAQVPIHACRPGSSA